MAVFPRGLFHSGMCGRFLDIYEAAEIGASPIQQFWFLSFALLLAAWRYCSYYAGPSANLTFSCHGDTGWDAHGKRSEQAFAISSGSPGSGSGGAFCAPANLRQLFHPLFAKDAG